ncbi:hypothetical protein TNCV_420891 [Trichonephila clavipes]|nr:hypothetical protein TNCV_420891 [Trichonephila clavipes]
MIRRANGKDSQKPRDDASVLDVKKPFTRERKNPLDVFIGLVPTQKSHGKIVKVEIGGVAIYRPFGEFRRANSYCHLYRAQGLG